VKFFKIFYIVLQFLKHIVVLHFVDMHKTVTTNTTITAPQPVITKKEILIWVDRL
jgi:hypothetical protein